ncbi:MAG: hypothetical protein KBT39_00320 [Bacteroidales bacterium]|nr:hypothetical protein [Bacteroidales bacterium]
MVCRQSVSLWADPLLFESAQLRLCALWLHLNHGIWSAMQTMGLNNKTWFGRLKTFSTLYSTLIILMFAAVAVLFCLGYTPSDIDASVLG